VWRDVADTTCRTAGLLAPLTFTRDPETYTAWWADAADRETITDTLHGLSDRCEVDYGLHSLMLDVFQSGIGPVPWLRANGLRRGVEPGYLVLDMDLAYGSDGIFYGVDVVASMHVESNQQTHWLTSSVNVDKPYCGADPVGSAPQSCVGVAGPARCWCARAGRWSGTGCCRRSRGRGRRGPPPPPEHTPP
jgi:hypothetical protein